MIKNNLFSDLEQLPLSTMTLQELAAQLDADNSFQAQSLSSNHIEKSISKQTKFSFMDNLSVDRIEQIALAHGSILDQELTKLLLAGAKQRKAPEESYIWIKHAVTALNKAIRQGHICIQISEIAAISKIEVSSVISYLHSSGLIDEIDTLKKNELVLSKNKQAKQYALDTYYALVKPFVLDQTQHLYWARHYQTEIRLAYALSQLLRPISNTAFSEMSLSHLIKEKDPVFFDQFFSFDIAEELFLSNNKQEKNKHNELKKTPMNWQKVASALAINSRLLIISGGPGTGKTTTVAAILGCLILMQNDLKIALAAPTGKAAQRMQKALLMQISHWPLALQTLLHKALLSSATTIHRLIGKKRGHNSQFNRYQPLPYDVVIIDEASMLDQNLSCELVEALNNRSRLILLGDKDQLSAVEAGAVFAELSQTAYIKPNTWQTLSDLLVIPNNFGYPYKAVSNEHLPLADCCVWLQKNYRFDEKSDLGCFANAIRNGDVCAAWSNCEFYEVTNLGKKVDYISNNKTLSLDYLSQSNGPMIDFAADSEGGETILSVLDTEQIFQKDALNGKQVRIVIDDGTALTPFSLQTIYAEWKTYIDAVANFLQISAKLTATEYFEHVNLLFEKFDTYRILSATRLGLRGTLAINQAAAEYIKQQLETRMHQSKMLSSTIADYFSSRHGFFIGQPLMITRNDYTLGVFNGDIGIILPDFSSTHNRALPAWQVVFQSLNDKIDTAATDYAQPKQNQLRQLPLNLLSAYETTFAMTIHKSQGSEFNRIGVVLPQSDYLSDKTSLITRELLYTGVTRARQSVTIYSEKSVVEHAILRSMTRNSSLRKRILEFSNL